MNDTPRAADTVIDAGWIIPVEPSGVVLHEHSLVLHQGVIVDIVPTRDSARYQAAERHALREHVLIPGLINLHTHAAMALMRGIADEAPSSAGFDPFAWPAQMGTTSANFVRDGALHACAEMLRAGITCFNDMYFFPDATAQAALQAGMRAVLGIFAIESASPYGSDAADCMTRGLAIRDALRDEPLLSFSMATDVAHSISNESLERMAIYAAELDLPVHIHLHETQNEIRECVSKHGQRPLQRVESAGLLGPSLIAVHAIHLTPVEIELLAQHGCHVAHCPVSNLKLAHGIAPVRALLEQHLNIGLGTENAASNHRMDILSEMRLAALLAKGTTGDATALPARQAREMATLGGARALGLETRIGSLKPGKRADVVAIDLHALELTPRYDLHSHLVYAAGREHVTHVWIDGRLRVEQRRLLSLDEAELRSKATYWQDHLCRLH